MKALLVDDERLARKRLSTLLEKHPFITVAGEAGDIRTAAALAEEIRPEVVFLDRSLVVNRDAINSLGRESI